MERRSRSGPRDFGPKPPVNQGEVLEVVIEAVGEKGDGIARKDGFVLFIPGVKEGDRVKVKVTRVLRKVGFAEVVGDAAEAPESSGDEEHEEQPAPMQEPEPEPEPEPSAEDTEDFGEELVEEASVEEDVETPEEPAEEDPAEEPAEEAPVEEPEAPEESSEEDIEAPEAPTEEKTE